jgi:type I restriction enzyme M protein
MLIADDGSRYDYVLPIHRSVKSSMTSTTEEGNLEKQELSITVKISWASTSNKQLNFLQHIKTN